MGCSSSKAAAQPAGLRGVGSQAAEQVFAGSTPRIKLVLLGDSGVGKSCLVQRAVHGQFDWNKAATIGAAFLAHTITLPGGQSIKFEIWDTAGQERYESLAPLYYRGASAAAIVYDVTSEKSFKRAQHWVGELTRNTAGRLVLVLVGNKADLAEARTVEEGAARDYAASAGMLCVETSAKTAANVQELFRMVAEQVVMAAGAGGTGAAAEQPAGSRGAAG